VKKGRYGQELQVSPGRHELGKQRVTNKKKAKGKKRPRKQQKQRGTNHAIKLCADEREVQSQLELRKESRKKKERKSAKGVESPAVDQRPARNQKILRH